jgi:flagellar biogenesis protein FliO
VSDLLAMLGRLFVPLLLTVGTLLALRRWLRQPAGTSQALRVVARAGLTRSAVVAIVAVGQRNFLLGASDAGVRMLQELEPSSAPEEAVSEGTDPLVQRPRNGLVDWLRERTVRAPSDGPGHAPGLQ